MSVTWSDSRIIFMNSVNLAERFCISFKSVAQLQQITSYFLLLFFSLMLQSLLCLYYCTKSVQAPPRDQLDPSAHDVI